VEVHRWQSKPRTSNWIYLKPKILWTGTSEGNKFLIWKLLHILKSFRFHERREISWLARWVLASQEEHSSMKFFSCKILQCPNSFCFVHFGQHCCHWNKRYKLMKQKVTSIVEWNIFIPLYLVKFTPYHIEKCFKLKLWILERSEFYLTHYIYATTPTPTFLKRIDEVRDEPHVKLVLKLYWNESVINFLTTNFTVESQ